MLRDLLFSAACIAVGLGAGYWLAVRRAKKRSGTNEYHVHIDAPGRDLGALYDGVMKEHERRQLVTRGTSGHRR